jgi:trans-aconitate methyltransferase
VRTWDGVLDYWRNRHRRRRGTWQAVGSGSVGHLAEWKVDLVNTLVCENGARSLLDLGCGDGRVSEGFEVETYLGLDPSPVAVAEARKRVGDRTGWSVQEYEPAAIMGQTPPADVSVSLDVVFHLIDDRLYFAYLTHLFHCTRMAVGIYSTNWDGPAHAHMRHRNVEQDVADWFPGWYLDESVAPPWPTMHYPDGSDCWWLVWKPRG